MRKAVLTILIVSTFVCAPEARADGWPESCLPPDLPAEACGDCGTIWSIQFLSGYFPMTGLGPNAGALWEKAKLDYAPQALRLGCESPDVFLPGTCIEGTWQGLLECKFSPILRDFGGYFSGPCALLRYNYRRDDSCLIPYVQVGVGLLLTDAHREQRQRLIGQPVEFLLRYEAGVRFLVTENVSLDVEGGFQHVSNGGLADRNGGINNLGASIGFTYEFGRK